MKVVSSLYILYSVCVFTEREGCMGGQVTAIRRWHQRTGTTENDEIIIILHIVKIIYHERMNEER